MECRKTFGLKRKKKSIKIWKEYSRKKQTYSQLSKKYKVSLPTIQKRLDSFKPKEYEIKPRKIMLIMDTVYFKRTFGVMVLRDWYERKNLLWRFVKNETIDLYKECVEDLISRGFDIEGIVVDGRRGIFNAFGKIPVQMCHFHQTKIVQRYITLNPKLQASIELWRVVHRMTRTDKESFEYWLKMWFEKWRDFLNEKSTDLMTGKWRYTHGRLRSAYNSLKSNLDNLYTYLSKDLYPKMPNTTNSLEGTFGHLKRKINLHAGLKIERKKKLLDELLRKNVTY